MCELSSGDAADCLTACLLFSFFTVLPLLSVRVQASTSGAYSVAGPCGITAGTASAKWGGVSGSVVPLVEGQQLSLTIGYNGGHQDAANAFHAAYTCGNYTVGMDVSNQEAKLKSTAVVPNRITLSNGQQTVPATQSLTSGYVLTFPVPNVPEGMNSATCIISLLDQRQWGGCIDVRISKAAPTPAASASSSTGSGETPAPVVVNPLLSQADTLSGIYSTQAGQCDTNVAAATNTLSGCCCLAGTLKLIHVQGSDLATLDSSNLTVSRGDMCVAGPISVPNYLNLSAAPSAYNYPSAVTQTAGTFFLRQKTDGSLDMSASLTIGGDLFDIELDGADRILILTNNAESKPRVCSTMARPTMFINSTGMAKPSLGAASANAGASATIVGLLAAFLAVVSRAL